MSFSGLKGFSLRQSYIVGAYIVLVIEEKSFDDFL